ncbi:MULTISPECIES: hypothetical protein [Cyanophyceae]|uniref:hypothetical protein n=1 Tax=Cyanophyceae TaxID=3028117 RepID=UPI0016855C14|nr:hypothetical protein [Trichocoleus sp. FACHB-69]MBD1935580.1 hypothetical protein [Trichocoleus sp. FACHB-69]
MTDSWSNYYNRQATPEELLLYTYLLDHVKVEPPNQLIELFRRLFIEGMEDSSSQVWQALERIVSSDLADQEFKFILNRSCYIPINHWENNPRFKEAIPKLIALFETPPTQLARSRTTQRLRQLVQCFRQTEQYRVLRYRTQQFSQKSEESNNVESRRLRTFLDRYPFIYEPCLLTNDSTDEQRQKVKSRQTQQQQQFDINLSHYITYQQLPKNSRSVKNPTLLSNDELNIAIQQFTGKVDGANTYKDLAERFRTSSRWTPCYRTFKKELYDEYLTASTNINYGNHQFNQKLQKHLQNTLVEYDTQRLSPILLVKTCRKLLDLLVVESAEQPKHYIFLDLTSNLGITPTIGLLLKIVLLCHHVKPYLEQKLAILFKHYEDYTKDKTKWLVDSLENLNVAFSTNLRMMNL